ncbi:SIS domain-containing protein [Bacillaceae bacterium SIJ1]|uniref:SIS domain-containing protein n=1 Tax=Litoribacterium kuwaitense TaxID=1398745 RepID=UPI0013ECF331|nr:SIS domain-containing protein [Litoribacterium kuwaitense]NGP46462.1 SIS domain-containing protein [Litoribacterium kuwaitense]
MIAQYFSGVDAILKDVASNEKAQLEEAAEHVAEAIQNNCIVHMFGCGHSHILTEEVFYRAGGLVPIHPIFHEPLMLHEGAVTSSSLERQNDYAERFMQDVDIQAGDVMIVLSTSGRNPVPVDAALIAKEKGAFVIGITSLTYSKSQPSRHQDGYHLYNAVDLVIDNYAPKGDALLQHDDVKVPFAPSSTVVGAAIINAVFAGAISRMTEKGFEPPIFLSGNIDGADEHNQALIDRYQKRIPLLR